MSNPVVENIRQQLAEAGALSEEDIKAAQDLLEEAKGLQDLQELSLGAEINEKAATIISELRELSDALDSAVRKQSTTIEYPFTYGSISNFQSDMDRNGAVLFVAEFGPETAIFPPVLPAAREMGFAEPMLTKFHRDSQIRSLIQQRQRRTFVRGDLSVSMRGFSYKPLGVQLNGIDRAIEEDPRRIGENHLFLMSLCSEALDIAFTDKCAISYDGSEPIRGISVGYFLAKEDMYDQLLDVFRESLESNYSRVADREVSESSLSEQKVTLFQSEPDLRLYEFIGVRE